VEASTIECLKINLSKLSIPRSFQELPHQNMKLSLTNSGTFFSVKQTTTIAPELYFLIDLANNFAFGI